MSMSAMLAPQPVTDMLAALTRLVLTSVRVLLVTLVTGGTVLTRTSASTNLATGTQNAETPKVHTVVTANRDLQAMEGHVWITMSAKQVPMTATRMPSVPI